MRSLKAFDLKTGLRNRKLKCFRRQWNVTVTYLLFLTPRAIYYRKFCTQIGWLVDICKRCLILNAWIGPFQELRNIFLVNVFAMQIFRLNDHDCNFAWFQLTYTCTFRLCGHTFEHSYCPELQSSRTESFIYADDTCTYT
jgi:hypothetical protein